MKTVLALVVTGLFLIACSSENTSTEDNTQYEILYAEQAPVIDGIGNEAVWATTKWRPMNHVWLGDTLDSADFSGRYKMLWNEDRLFYLFEIVDDSLMDQHADGLYKYWDDDCLELFIDENASGGNHQYNHNAFAYHIALDYKVADLGQDSLPGYYNDHLETKRTSQGKLHTWEVSMKVFNDQYQDFEESNPTVRLYDGKKLGLAAAYCDNDSSPEREHFIGSMPISGTDKNRAWIDASLFEQYILIKK